MRASIAGSLGRTFFPRKNVLESLNARSLNARIHHPPLALTSILNPLDGKAGPGGGAMSCYACYGMSSCASSPSCASLSRVGRVFYLIP